MLRKHIKSLIFISGLLISTLSFANDTNNLLRSKGDPVGGNPKGSVTVVEFFDFQCSHCVTMAGVVNDAIKANPHLRVVYKDLPVRGPVSQLAAQAALAANKQGKYKVFAKTLFDAPQPLSENAIYQAAKTAGLNVNKLKKDMQDRSVKNILMENIRLAQRIKLTGTPAFFIAKTDATNESQIKFILGEMSPRELQTAIDNARR